MSPTYISPRKCGWWPQWNVLREHVQEDNGWLLSKSIKDCYCSLSISFGQFLGLLAATHCCPPASTCFVKLPSGQFSFGQISRGYAVQFSSITFRAVDSCRVPRPILGTLPKNMRIYVANLSYTKYLAARIFKIS